MTEPHKYDEAVERGMAMHDLVMDAHSESRMLKKLLDALELLGSIAFKHGEISRGRLFELTGKSPEQLAERFPQILEGK